MAKNNWDFISSMKEARFHHGCGTINHKEILVVGGQNGIGNLLGSSETFSLVTLQWRDSASLPEQAMGPMVSIQYGTSVLVLGATSVYQFDEMNYEWAEREEMLSMGRYGYVAIPITGM